jgi:putative tricarboxylic transport membrane protein
MVAHPSGLFPGRKSSVVKIKNWGPDLVVLLLTLGLAGLYLYATESLPKLEVGDPLGPKAFPRLLVVGLLISAAMLYSEMRQKPGTNVAADIPEEVQERPSPKLIGAIVIWTFIYFSVFEWLGYIISTTAYLVVLTAYFNRGKWVANIASSVLFSVLSYLLFKLLETSLPPGLLPF